MMSLSSHHALATKLFTWSCDNFHNSWNPRTEPHARRAVLHRGKNSSNFILHPTTLDFQLAWVTFCHGNGKQLNSYLMTFYLSFYPPTPRWRSIPRNGRSPWQPAVIKLITYEDGLPYFKSRSGFPLIFGRAVFSAATKTKSGIGNEHRICYEVSHVRFSHVMKSGLLWTSKGQTCHHTILHSVPPGVSHTLQQDHKQQDAASFCHLKPWWRAPDIYWN